MARQRRILGAALVASVCSVALFGAPAANASHIGVLGSVQILRDGNPIALYQPSAAPFCSSTVCSVDVAMPGRDYGRFVSLARGTSVNVSVPVGSNGNVVGIAGPGRWGMNVGASLCGNPCIIGDAVNDHGTPLTVTVNAVRQ